MSLLSRVDRIVISINEWILLLIGITFTVLILLQVFARYVLQFSIFHIDALSGFLLVWFSFVGIGLAFRYGMHASMDLVETLVPTRVKFQVGVFRILTSIVFFLFLILASMVALPISMRNLNPSMGVSYAWGVAALPVGSAFAVWHLAVMLREMATGQRVNALEPLADFGMDQA